MKPGLCHHIGLHLVFESVDICTANYASSTHCCHLPSLITASIKEPLVYMRMKSPA